MIDGLDRETLVKVAKESFMSRPQVLKDVIAKLTAGPEEPEQSSETSAVPFCVCGYCRAMPKDKERLCCKERRLRRSTTLAFQNTCLDSDNLATVRRSLEDTYVFTPTYDNRTMRHAGQTCISI